jgi:hypothetical protein
VVLVMFGVVIFVLCAAVAFAAVKDARVANAGGKKR